MDLPGPNCFYGKTKELCGLSESDCSNLFGIGSNSTNDDLDAIDVYYHAKWENSAPRCASRAPETFYNIILQQLGRPRCALSYCDYDDSVVHSPES